jgi:hypothetical protein
LLVRGITGSNAKILHMPFTLTYHLASLTTSLASLVCGTGIERRSFCLPPPPHPISIHPLHTKCIWAIHHSTLDIPGPQLEKKCRPFSIWKICCMARESDRPYPSFSLLQLQPPPVLPSWSSQLSLPFSTTHRAAITNPLSLAGSLSPCA